MADIWSAANGGPCLRKSSRSNDVQTEVQNPSLHKPAQQAGAAQVINAPPNGPQGYPTT